VRIFFSELSPAGTCSAAPELTFYIVGRWSKACSDLALQIRFREEPGVFS
jgi:hypothetical protein